MKNNHIKAYAVLAVVFIALIAASALGIADGFELFALPFTLVGRGLRWLSLSGDVGNAAAIVLYVLVSLSPLLLKLRKKWTARDILLPICSALMFYVLYCMINPGFRAQIIQNYLGDVAMAAAVYGVLLCWWMIGLVGSVGESDAGGVYGTLRIFVLLFMVLIAASAAVGLGDCIKSIREVREGNTDPSAMLAPTNIFIAVSYAVKVLEYGLDIFLLHLSGRLLGELSADAYGEASCNAAKRLSKWCGKSVVIITAAAAALNIAQLLLAGMLYSLNFELNLPIESIGLAFVLMGITRLLYQGKELKDDNELFV